MKKIPREKNTSVINLRRVPEDLAHRIKMAAAAEHRSVKGFLLHWAEERIRELERAGTLSKRK